MNVHHRWTGLAVVASAAVWLWTSDSASQEYPGRENKLGGKPGQRRRAEAAATLPSIPGTLLTKPGSYDGQPSVAVTPAGRSPGVAPGGGEAGTTWTAWVGYADRGADDVVVAALTDGKPGEPVKISPAPGQYVRPVLASVGDELWCLWTATHPDSTSTVWYARRTGGAWTPASRLLPDEARAHQNPEVAVAMDGRIAVVCQVHNGTDYDIHLRIWDGKAWGPPQALSDAATSDWDPAAAFDAKGNLHVVWSGWADGDYDIYRSLVSLPSLSSSTPQRITARGDYDLHPCLAAAPDGAVWLAWDAVHILNHGRSGKTTITGANLRGDEDESHGRNPPGSWIDVRVLSADGSVRVPGRPRAEIAAPKGFVIAHTGMAKIAVGPTGEPWIVHRVLRREADSPGIGYHWQVVARPFRGGRWADPVLFESSDGYLEEAGVATAPDGLRIAYGGEHRRAHIPGQPGGPAAADGGDESGPDDGSGAKAAAAEAAVKGGEASADHSRDFNDRLGWKGDVYVATLGSPTLGESAGGGRVEGAAGAPDVAALPAEKSLADRPAEDRLGRKDGRHDVAADGKTFRLLWGDTHRHSNVSRCSQGAEPCPDDHYRYGTDVCRYDFFALSDHAEDPRLNRQEVIDFYWWKQQKLADLYHVPGFMSVLYNYEWSLLYPEGHHNTVYPGRPTIHLSRQLSTTDTLKEGWALLAKDNLRAITIPHTGADPRMGTAWEVQDDRYQRLCEIFQACRGSYEHPGCPREFRETSNKKGFYWNALEKGYHVGVICSSDHGLGCAYACVYAPENTRESVWQAMYDRRTYGSTTYGLVLEMRGDGHWMGEEWKSKEAPKLEIYVRGAVPIRSVEILGRSKVLHAEGSLDKPLNTKEHRIAWTDPEWADQAKEQWYYVRVIQTDDEMAWSSPVWITPQKEAN